MGSKCFQRSLKNNTMIYRLIHKAQKVELLTKLLVLVYLINQLLKFQKSLLQESLTLSGPKQE